MTEATEKVRHSLIKSKEGRKCGLASLPPKFHLNHSFLSHLIYGTDDPGCDFL